MPAFLEEAFFKTLSFMLFAFFGEFPDPESATSDSDFGFQIAYAIL